jgi:hypothetical protein
VELRRLGLHRLGDLPGRQVAAVGAHEGVRADA